MNVSPKHVNAHRLLQQSNCFVLLVLDCPLFCRFWTVLCAPLRRATSLHCRIALITQPGTATGRIWLVCRALVHAPRLLCGCVRFAQRSTPTIAQLAERQQERMSGGTEDAASLQNRPSAARRQARAMWSAPREAARELKRVCDAAANMLNPARQRPHELLAPSAHAAAPPPSRLRRSRGCGGGGGGDGWRAARRVGAVLGRQQRRCSRRGTRARCRAWAPRCPALETVLLEPARARLWASLKRGAAIALLACSEAAHALPHFVPDAASRAACASFMLAGRVLEPEQHAWLPSMVRACATGHQLRRRSVPTPAPDAGARARLPAAAGLTLGCCWLRGCRGFCGTFALKSVVSRVGRHAVRRRRGRHVRASPHRRRARCGGAARHRHRCCGCGCWRAAGGAQVCRPACNGWRTSPCARATSPVSAPRRSRTCSAGCARWLHGLQPHGEHQTRATRAHATLVGVLAEVRRRCCAEECMQP